MKRFWAAVVILFLLFSATCANSLYLVSFTRQLTDLLLEAEARCESGGWDRAMELTQKAEELWEDHSTYLHTTLRHAEIDEVELTFRQVKELLRRREDGEYSATNARLMGAIYLLCEQEQVNLKNIL